MPGLDQDVLRHALRSARENGYRFVWLRLGKERFEACLGSEPETQDDDDWATAADSANEPAEAEQRVTSPVVGYFRNAETPLEPGMAVEAGQIVGEIVALGISNDVLTKFGGEVSEVRVAEGDPVEFGQVIAVVRQT